MIPEEAASGPGGGTAWKMARSIGTWKGRIALNALAIISGMRPDSLVQATNYAVEALAIAKVLETNAAWRSVPRIWRSYARSSGFGRRISLFSKALDGFRELKHPKTLDLIRYLAALITARSKTRPGRF